MAGEILAATCCGAEWPPQVGQMANKFEPFGVASQQVALGSEEGHLFAVRPAD